MDLLSVGTTYTASGSLRTLSGRGGRAEPLPPVTAADDLLGSYADLVERYVDGAPDGLGHITPHQLVNTEDRTPTDDGLPVELDGSLLPNLLQLYLVDGWAGLRAYDEGWRKLTRPSPASAGVSDAEASPEATRAGTEFYALTRELITVAISNALATIAAAAGALVRDKLKSCLDVAAAAAAKFGLRPGDPPTVDASLATTRAAVTAFQEAERTGWNFVQVANGYAGIRDYEPRSEAARAALPRAREASKQAFDRAQEEYATALQAVVEIAPFLAGHVQPDLGARRIRSPGDVTKLMAKLLTHLTERLLSMQGDALDADSVLPYRSVTGGKGWLITYPAETATAERLTPLPTRGPDAAVIELASARTNAPVGSAVTSLDVLDLLVEDESLGELEQLVLQRLTVEVAALQPAAPAEPAAEQKQTVTADDLAGAVVGLAGLAVRTSAVTAAGAVLAGVSIAKSVLLYAQMYRQLDDAEIRSVVTANSPTDFLYRFGVIQGMRGELTKEVVKQVLLAAAASRTGGLFGPSWRVWGATQDVYAVVTFVREAVR